MIVAVATAFSQPARSESAYGLPGGKTGIAEYAYFRAVDLNVKGSPREAVGLLRLAIEARPDVALYHEALGDTYLALNQTDTAVLALEQYKEALRLEPGRTRAYEGLIQAAMIAGRLDDAIDSLEVLTFRSGTVQVRYLTDLVSLYIVADQPERGIKALAGSHPSREARAIVLLGLATLHRYRDTFGEAISLAGRAAADEAAPDDVRAMARDLVAKWDAERRQAQ